MRFTLRQLELFVAACETESITLAAEREHISQSAASSAIAQLERALGAQLLIRRHAHGVTTTPAGRQLLQRARLVLAEAGSLERLSDELTTGITGTLELGSLVTLAPIVVPALCRSFQRRYPDASFRMVEDGQDGLLRRIHNGEISLALTYDLGLDNDVAFQQLAALPPVALLPEHHACAGRSSIELDELAGEQLILLDLPLSREYFLSLFLAKGLDPDVRFRSPHPEMVRSLVANGFGYAIYNARPIAEQSLDGQRIATVPLSGGHRPMRLGLASLAHVRPTRLVSAFRSHCAQTIADDGVPGMRHYQPDAPGG